MSNLTVYTTTFNCGRNPLDIDFFASHLFHALTPSTSRLPPDLLVLALQEIAPVGHSFIGGTLLSPYLARFKSAVQRATTLRFNTGGKDEVYDVLATENVGMTGIVVFARPEVQARVRRVERAGVGFGHWDMGNKGAVGVRVWIEDVPVTFVAAHLAPAEDQWERRNLDWRSLCEGLVFEGQQQRGTISSSNPKDGSEGEETEPLLADNNDNDNDDQAATSEQKQHSLFSPPSHIILAGDLNYRTSNTSPQPTDHKSWPTTASDATSSSNLLERDQLTRERTDSRTLHLLSEAKITFPPTYKYSSAAQKHARQLSPFSPSEGELNIAVGNTAAAAGARSAAKSYLWAKHRVPSWCDRILFLSDNPPEVHAYAASPVQPTSDHRPVVLSCSLPSGMGSGRGFAQVNPPFEVRAGWRERRAAARRLEVVVGLLAYLTCTWEGEAVLAGTVVGVVGCWLVMRSLIVG